MTALHAGEGLTCCVRHQCGHLQVYSVARLDRQRRQQAITASRQAISLQFATGSYRMHACCCLQFADVASRNTALNRDQLLCSTSDGMCRLVQGMSSKDLLHVAPVAGL